MLSAGVDPNSSFVPYVNCWLDRAVPILAVSSISLCIFATTLLQSTGCFAASSSNWPKRLWEHASLEPDLGCCCCLYTLLLQPALHQLLPLLQESASVLHICSVSAFRMSTLLHPRHKLGNLHLGLLYKHPPGSQPGTVSLSFAVRFARAA